MKFQQQDVDVKETMGKYLVDPVFSFFSFISHNHSNEVFQ